MKQKYEVVRPGCATWMEKCPHGDRAVTVQPLDAKGRPKPGGTICVSSETIQEGVR